MNDLNKIVCDFIWEGKGVKIAQKTGWKEAEGWLEIDRSGNQKNCNKNKDCKSTWWEGGTMGGKIF